ncbi:MAG TPA: sulfotransferase [Thermoanaerobaculia bacterium]|nr:sulfotransferase [Thermoanaerobaculia bacterium]
MSPAPERIEGRIFLVGCPRSGTTLLQSLLAAHSAVVSFPETHAFAHLVPRFPLARRLGLTNLRTWHRFRRSVQELGSTAPARPTLRWRPAARLLLGALDRAALARGGRVWLEKTPRHLHYLSEITAVAAQAHFIHLLREGSEVVASLYEVTRQAPETWGGPRSLERCVRRWQEDVALSLARAGDERHTLVLYDELVRDPERSLRYLGGRLGLGFERAQLEGYRAEAARLVRADELWKKDAGGDIRPLPSGKVERLFDEATREWLRGRVASQAADLEQLRRAYLAATSER